MSTAPRAGLVHDPIAEPIKGPHGEIEALYAQAEALRLAGRYRDALPLISEATERLDRSNGTSHELAWPVRIAEVRLLVATGRWTKALERFSEYVPAIERELGPRHHQTGLLHMTRAHLALDMSDLVQAAAAIDAAADGFPSSDPSFDLDQLTLETYLGSLLLEQASPQEAHQLLTSEAAFWKAAHEAATDAPRRGETGQGLALVTLALGRAWNALDEESKALDCYWDATDQYEVLLQEQPEHEGWQRQLCQARSRILVLLTPTIDGVGDIEGRADLTEIKLLVHQVLEQRDRLHELDPTSEIANREMAIAWIRQAEFSRARTDLLQAQLAYVRALALAEALLQRWPDNARRHTDVALILGRMSKLEQGEERPKTARRLLERAVQLGEEGARRSTVGDTEIEALCYLLGELTTLEQADQRRSEAQQAMERRLIWCGTLAQRFPIHIAHHVQHGLAHGRLAQDLEAAGDLEGAILHGRAMGQIFERIRQGPVDQALKVLPLAAAQLEMTTWLKQEQSFTEGIDVADDVRIWAAAQREDVLTMYPESDRGDPWMRLVARAELQAARVALGMPDPAQAPERFARAKASYLQVLAAKPDDLDVRIETSGICGQLSLLLHESDLEAALVVSAEAIALLEAGAPLHPDDRNLLQTTGIRHDDHAVLLRRSRQPERAAHHQAEAERFLSAVQQRYPQEEGLRIELAICLERGIGDLVDDDQKAPVIARLERARAFLVDSLSPRACRVHVSIAERLAELYDAIGNHERSAQVRDQLIELGRTRPDHEDPDCRLSLAMALNYRAWDLSRAGRSYEAGLLNAEGIAVLEARLEAQPTVQNRFDLLRYGLRAQWRLAIAAEDEEAALASFDRGDREMRQVTLEAPALSQEELVMTAEWAEVILERARCRERFGDPNGMLTDLTLGIHLLRTCSLAPDAPVSIARSLHEELWKLSRYHYHRGPACCMLPCLRERVAIVTEFERTNHADALTFVQRQQTRLEWAEGLIQSERHVEALEVIRDLLPRFQPELERVADQHDEHLEVRLALTEVLVLQAECLRHEKDLPSAAQVAAQVLQERRALHGIASSWPGGRDRANRLVGAVGKAVFALAKILEAQDRQSDAIKALEDVLVELDMWADQEAPPDSEVVYQLALLADTFAGHLDRANRHADAMEAHRFCQEFWLIYRTCLPPLAWQPPLNLAQSHLEAADLSRRQQYWVVMAQDLVAADRLLSEVEAIEDPTLHLGSLEASRKRWTDLMAAKEAGEALESDQMEETQ